MAGKVESRKPSMDGWSKEKPTFKEECLLLTATKIRDNWEYHLYEILFALGENDKGESAWYWGIFQDGDEWGDLNDLHAQLYFTMPLVAPFVSPFDKSIIELP